VLRVPWVDYDLEERYFKVIDLKGRGAHERVHLVPLSDRAVELLGLLLPITGQHQWPFSYTGEAPISIESLKNVTRRFLAHQNGFEHFTVRDLRRTCKQIMTQARIPREHRNLLQSHGATGVDAKHYDNDPMLHLPLKKEVMAHYDQFLGVIFGEQVENKVVQLRGA
jgi:integrase